MEQHLTILGGTFRRGGADLGGGIAPCPPPTAYGPARSRWGLLLSRVIENFAGSIGLCGYLLCVLPVSVDLAPIY